MPKLERLEKKFGKQRMEMMLPRMKETGSKELTLLCSAHSSLLTGLAEGINFSYGGVVANTIHAHRLAKWAAQFGKQDQVGHST
jgi:predicted DsbA family dithiol-disulfide isomerase